MTTPLEKIAEEKKRNYQSSLKGGGVPPIGKRPIYFRGFLLKASLTGKDKLRLGLHPAKFKLIVEFRFVLKLVEVEIEAKLGNQFHGGCGYLHLTCSLT